MSRNRSKIIFSSLALAICANQAMAETAQEIVVTGRRPVPESSVVLIDIADVQVPYFALNNSQVYAPVGNQVLALAAKSAAKLKSITARVQQIAKDNATVCSPASTTTLDGLASELDAVSNLLVGTGELAQAHRLMVYYSKQIGVNNPAYYTVWQTVYRQWDVVDALNQQFAGIKFDCSM